MIEKIIEISIRNKFMVLLVTGMLVIAGIWATIHISLDAVPDLSDVQVIVTTDYAGQAPNVVEDQVTYPLTTAMMGIPHAKVVRGVSMFEQSFIYIIFDDGTDLYWARSRVLEYLNFVKDRLPAGVEPKLGPDATGVGWVYQYLLYPGYYSPDHPNGIWHDEANDKWYGDPSQAPTDRKAALVKVRAFEKPGVCPLDGKPLVSSHGCAQRGRSRTDRRFRQRISGGAQTRTSAGVQPASRHDHDGDSAVQQRRWRFRDRVERNRIYGSQSGLSQGIKRPRACVGWRRERWHTHHAFGCGNPPDRR